MLAKTRQVAKPQSPQLVFGNISRTRSITESGMGKNPELIKTGCGSMNISYHNYPGITTFFSENVASGKAIFLCALLLSGPVSTRPPFLHAACPTAVKIDCSLACYLLRNGAAPVFMFIKGHKIFSPTKSSNRQRKEDHDQTTGATKAEPFFGQRH